MNEAIQRILEAARSDNPEQMVGIILDHERKAAADEARGVEDVTAGLKSALEKVKADRDALNGKLGEAEAALEKARQEAQAKDHNVDNDVVEKLANERAAAMSERAVQAAQDEAKRLQTELDAATADRAHLVNRLEIAYVDLDMVKNGGADVNPLFYPLLRDNVRPYMKIDEDSSGDRAWWRRDADKPPRFIVVDPQDGKTKLTGKSGPMQTGELLASKRVGDWADFWPRTDGGPGGSTASPQNGATPTVDAFKTPGITQLEQILGSPE